MKRKNRKEKIDATDVIYKLEFAQKCAEISEDFESVKTFGRAIQQVKDCYDYDDGENPYMKIIIDKNRALVKCDVWAKMAVIDFAHKTGIWIPKVCDTFKDIRFFNGCS